MARLVPLTELNDIAVRSERSVAKALIEALPDNCVVYHSYPWLRLERSRYKPENQSLIESETDFLILWPDRGILVLEVKGGGIRLEESTRQWFSCDRHGEEFRIKDPFEQAAKGFHRLKDLIIRDVYPDGSIPFAFGYAVCFPDLEYGGGVVPGSDPSIIVDCGDLGTSRKFRSAIENALNKWDRREKPGPMPAGDKRIIEQAISPAFRLIHRMSHRIANQEEQLIRLTEEQYRILESCQYNLRVAVEGVAGSGKTLLALAQAEFYAQQGKPTLVLCYNKALAQWMRESIAEQYDDLIQVYHFHGLVAEVCERAGVEFSPGNDSGFWTITAAQLLSDALMALPDFRFDALVVDEAQDFAEEWWLVLDELNAEGDRGPLFVFYDPKQVLFQPRECIPELYSTNRLLTNCRNTIEISSTCSSIIGEDIACHWAAPNGDKVEHVAETSAILLCEGLQIRLGQLLRQEGVRPEQVAILSPRRIEASTIKNIKQVAGVSLDSDLDRWRAGESILTTTIRAFKGLEADVVILLLSDEPKPESVFTQNDYYVACSRAKHLLIVFSEIEFDFASMST